MRRYHRMTSNNCIISFKNKLLLILIIHTYYKHYFDDTIYLTIYLPTIGDIALLECGIRTKNKRSGRILSRHV